MNTYATAALTAILLGQANLGAAEPELVMPPTPISASGDRSVFSTPIDYQRGHLVVAQVEQEDAYTKSGYLRTVIRHGSRAADGSWQWHSRTLDQHTLYDPYHTQPSVTFDQNGFIHVVYNMHHVPWQYVVSKAPYDIASFDFRGDPVTQAELDTIRLQNKTHFPTDGSASIPGNQITYPAFIKDRKQNLYVVYRYAMKPARSWAQRSYAFGLAKYDLAGRNWTAIGTSIPRQIGDTSPTTSVPAATNPFLFDKRYLPYTVTLAFDGNNDMHAIWTWWDSHACLDGSVTVSPSYRFLADGTDPGNRIGYGDVERIPGWPKDTVFNTSKAIAIAANGDVLAILEPKDKPRQLIRRFRDSGQWSVPVDTPNSASKIRVTRDGTEWLFASGLRLFKRVPGGTWSAPIIVGKDLCDPWPVYSAEENAFYIRAKACSDFATAVVYRYQIS